MTIPTNQERTGELVTQSRSKGGLYPASSVRSQGVDDDHDNSDDKARKSI